LKKPVAVRTVLVTGGTGFLGGAVVRALLGAGHRVRLLARQPEKADRQARAGAVEVVKGDILAPATVAGALTGVDAVVHVAGLISVRAREQEQLYQINVEGTRNVLGAACERGLRVLHTSSVATLGTTEAPQLRDEQDPLDLADAAGYPYAASKHQSEAVALDLARAGGDVVVLNPGLLLGPGDVSFSSTRIVREHLLGRLRFTLAGGISFADARDVADGYVAALTRGRAGQRYLLAGINLGYPDLVERLHQVTGLPGAWPVPGLAARWFGMWSQLAAAVAPHPLDELNAVTATYGSRFNYCRVDKAVRELGYVQRPIEQTLRDTVIDHLERDAALPVPPAMRDLVRRAS
jgi:dihydroflavonol-4-reductase